MTARRVARELAVIVLPQVPKDKDKIDRLTIEDLVARAVQMLINHARELLEAASTELGKAAAGLNDIESDHPDNTMKLENLRPVPLTSDQLRGELEKIESAVSLIGEALDLPDFSLHGGKTRIEVPCSKCKHVNSVLIDRHDRSEVRGFLVELLGTYLDHRLEIDEFIKAARAKWKVERMVSIDRDILRLACAEALYMQEIPVKVAINEAVELCHRFADERAARFVNGVLADLVVEAEYFREHGEFRAGKSPVDDAIDSEGMAAGLDSKI